MINIIKKIIIFVLLFFIYNNSNSQTEHPNDAGQLIRIPVVFHIVNDSLTKNDISDDDLKTIIKTVNEGFNNVDVSKIIPEYRNIVATCNIEFFIPKKIANDLGRESPSISWHTPSKQVYESNPNMDSDKQLELADFELKSNGYINSNKYLNIWIAKLNGVSYSSFPHEKRDLIDGIVFNIKNFYHYNNELKKIQKTNPRYTAMVLTHEIGHWLGLYHIWGKTTVNSVGNCICSPLIPYSFCDDDIRDTPKQKGPNKLNFKGKKDSLMLKTCSLPKSTAPLSNYQNFMDYSYNVGMFTEGQKIKMRYNIFEYRLELLAPFSSYNLKKIAINSQYTDKLEFTITSLDGSNYKSTFHNNYKNIVKGRYLFQINDYKTKKGIANNTFVIKDKGIIILINKYGCTKWKYIGDERLYDFSFNINKLEGKCNSYSNTSTRNTRNTRYKSRKRKSSNSNRRKSSGNKSYDDAYKRAQKMYDKGYKRANDMYNKARKKHR